MGARPPERSPAASGSSGRALLTNGTEDYVYTPSGTPIEQVASSATSNSSVTYLLQDGTGSTRLLANSTGSVVATYAYDAYGNLTTDSGSATTPLLFQGQYYDQALGAYDLRARWYDPGSAQFLSVDPLVAATESPFGYAGGDPVNFSDPTGLLCIDGPPSESPQLCGAIGLRSNPQLGVPPLLLAPTLPLGAVAALPCSPVSGNPTSSNGPSGSPFPPTVGAAVGEAGSTVGGAGIAGAGAEGLTVILSSAAAGEIGGAALATAVVSTGGLVVVGLLIVAGGVYLFGGR